MYAASAATSEFWGAFWSSQNRSRAARLQAPMVQRSQRSRNVPRPTPPTVTRCVLVSGLRPCIDSSVPRSGGDERRPRGGEWQPSEGRDGRADSKKEAEQSHTHSGAHLWLSDLR